MNPYNLFQILIYGFVLTFRINGYIIAQKNLERPNVLFVLFDDLRPAVNGYGDVLAKTPNIDQLMSRSFYFTNAYCQQSLCAPSRNSMLTSRRPDTLHLYDFDNYWRSNIGNFTTIPQYFKSHNYNTYSFGKIFHPGKSSNFSDDFPASWSRRTFHPSTEKYMNSPVCSYKSGKLKANLICPVKIKFQPESSLPDIQSIQKVRNFIMKYNKYNSTKPFFLALGFHKPHIPFTVPQKWYKKFPRHIFNSSECKSTKHGLPNVAWNPFNDIRKRDDVKKLNVPFPFGPIPESFQVSIKQAYYSAVAYVDNLLGKILKIIDKNNTIVVVTSDHGWSLGEHCEWAKYSNFEVSVKVPLIVYSPEFKLKARREIKSIVELVDIFPSLVDLTKLPRIPKCTQNQDLCTEGKSFYNLLKTSKTNMNRFALSQYPRPGSFPTKRPNSDEPKLRQIRIMGYSIRTHEFRYSLWVKFNWRNFQKDWNTTYGEELYDHRFDDKEDQNLANNTSCRYIRDKLKHMLIKHFPN